MHVDLVWLTATLLSFPLLTLCDPLNVLVAPNLLRIGTPERVFVEAQDYSGNDFQVKIIVKNHPQGNTELTSESVILNAANSFQAVVNIVIPDNKNFFSDDPLEKQYVYLQAQFPSGLLEKVALVSFQSGYIFVQTDKSIYTPGTEVLPSFEVALKPSKSFFYVDDPDLQVDITAKYLFGKDVDGVAFVVFGVKKDDSKHPLPASLQRVPVYVTNPDQSPAENVEVLVKPGDVRGRTKSNGLAKVIVSTQGGDKALQITILSKGQIVKAEKFKRQGQSLVTLSLPISKDLVPSFRVVAYYHIGPSEVVSDSVWVDVNNDCMGKLKLDVKESLNVKKVFEPGDEFHLIVTGDPSAKVGLVAVDKAVFVLNKNRLTQTKIWDIIDKHDTGCTAGSGKNDMGVFYDAGLLFHSDKAGGTNVRTVGNYTGEQKKCCGDGLRPNRLGYTCERRATYILDGSECVQAFLYCCKEIQKHKDDQRELLHLARSEDDDDDYISSDEIVTRTQFPESWLWEDIDLPACAGNLPCDTTSLTLGTNYLKDSITTWQVLAISLSKTHGICVADPYEITVAKDFFIDLKLPYSAVRNEQLEIKAVLYNFSNKKHKVRVEFFETEHVCSAASKKSKYRVIVNIDAKSTRAIPYVIIPMEIGLHNIEVQAATATLHDGVRKTLKVVSEGVLTELPEQNLELNPSRVPGQEVSQTIEQAISGNFMGRLIVQPTGCGEQNMIYMTLPLIATHYLDTTKQWEGVGVQRRSEAIQHIQTGYARELTFRKPDGSYAAWLQRPSSTWLTAYVSKVFALASDLISIDENILCGSIKWLILNAQMPDGEFKESAPVIQGEMVSLPEASKKAIAYLERRLPSLTNQYAVAISSYALANAGKFNRDLLLQFSSEDGAYWQVSGGHHFSLEATAYAVLALVKAKEFDAAGKAVNWLNRQSSPYGGYGTTQATIIVFQAVAEYYKQVRAGQNADLDVEVVTLYYARPIEKKSDCTKYDLKVELKRERLVSYPDAQESYEVIIDVLYKDPNRDATMTILDIGLLTGFVVDEKDLTDLTIGRDKYIQKFEMDKQLSERGSLIIYVDKVSHTVPDRIVFRVHKITNVALLQPAAVSVYEFYSPGERCVKFYHPVKKDGALTRLCSDQQDLCQCAEVYKVKVLKLDLNPNTDFYELKIEEVLKEGSDPDVREKVRSFMGHANCRESFGFEEGKSYLIMGRSADLPRIADKYVNSSANQQGHHGLNVV
ncbi:hypothetical protein AMELA_G00234670 [Ameiurus melas]|uniref:Uncharacterized protein n=1 Tax=Ameiurus melas TaxID=219545 RepID=A0A7J5ZY45_AMEME|nr:hypothetical protein AMELA_G00234670 [Ameiurus melas]